MYLFGETEAHIHNMILTQHSLIGLLLPSLNHVEDPITCSHIPEPCDRRLGWESLPGMEQKNESSDFFFQYTYMF